MALFILRGFFTLIIPESCCVVYPYLSRLTNNKPALTEVTDSELLFFEFLKFRSPKVRRERLTASTNSELAKRISEIIETEISGRPLSIQSYSCKKLITLEFNPFFTTAAGSRIPNQLYRDPDKLITFPVSSPSINWPIESMLCTGFSLEIRGMSKLPYSPLLRQGTCL